MSYGLHPTVLPQGATMLIRIATILLLLVVTSLPLGAQPIAQSKGTDARVDDVDLTWLGPWDDRKLVLIGDAASCASPCCS